MSDTRRYPSGSLRYFDGMKWQVATPADPSFSTVSLLATEFWDDNRGWLPIIEFEDDMEQDPVEPTTLRTTDTLQPDPCPFCGDTPELTSEYPLGVEEWELRCCVSMSHSEHGASEEDVKRKLIEKWNTRKPPPSY